MRTCLKQVRFGLRPGMGMVLTGSGAVVKNLTCGLPMLYPRDIQTISWVPLVCQNNLLVTHRHNHHFYHIFFDVISIYLESIHSLLDPFGLIIQSHPNSGRKYTAKFSLNSLLTNQTCQLELTL